MYSTNAKKFHKEKSNKMQQYNKTLLFIIYMKLNMFQATHRLSLCLTTSTNYTFKQPSDYEKSENGSAVLGS
jgi:hypothetical protein